MSWLPGWNSIEDADRWSAFYFWLGAVAFFVLGVSQVLAHKYGLRRQELTAEAAADERKAVARRSEASDGNQGTAEPEPSAAPTRANVLTPEYRDVLLSAAKGFRGQAVYLSTTAMGGKAAALTREIGDALTASGWKVDRTGSLASIADPTEPTSARIIVNTEEPEGSSTHLAAATLARGFVLLGVQREAEFYRSPGCPVGSITVSIGAKARPLGD